MDWWTWLLIAATLWVALAPVGLALMRGANILNARAKRMADEHEEGLPL